MWLAEVVCVPSVAYLMVYLLATAESQSQAGYNCFNSTGIQGNCIAISLCPEIMAMTTHKPRIPEEVKFMKKSLCGFERNQPKVCCPDSMVDRTTEFYDKGDSINLIPDQKGCGKYREEEAFGDSTTTADFRDFPWMALLLYNNTLGILNDLYCAGVLISNRYVLTAANCIRGQRVTKTYLQLTGVRLGEWSTETNPDCRFGECAPEYQDIPVESTVVHSNYNPENPNQRDDIALLRLSRDVVYSDWIGAVCLPLISSGVTQKNRVGNFLVLSGWDKIDEISAFDVKQKTLVSVFPPENCISVYEKVQGVSFSPSQICAGGKGEVIADPFRGEGGNPLLSLEYEWDKVNWYVAAIVSFRPSSCYAEACPGIYTDVSKYDTWILRNIKP